MSADAKLLERARDGTRIRSALCDYAVGAKPVLHRQLADDALRDLHALLARLHDAERRATLAENSEDAYEDDLKAAEARVRQLEAALRTIARWADEDEHAGIASLAATALAAVSQENAG